MAEQAAGRLEDRGCVRGHGGRHRPQALSQALVGRVRELGVLADAVDAGARRFGRTVVILGVAGIGKSRMAREAADMARAGGGTVLVGRGVPDEATPFRPLAEVARAGVRKFGIPPHDLLRAVLPAVSVLMPELAEPDVDRVALSPLTVGEAVLRLARVLNPGHPALLILEDLHWADPDTLATVEYLADNLAEEAVTMVATCRTEERSPGLALARRLTARRVAEPLELEPLGDADVGMMIRGCPGGGDLPQSIVEAVSGRAEGIPFFVEELLASAQDAWARGVRSCPGEVSAGPGVVPVSFADTVRRRLSDLGPRGQEVLRAAAVLGRDFDWRRLGPIVGEENMLEVLGRATVMQLLSLEDDSGEPVFRFRHVLTRDAIIGELLPHERMAVARRALEELERRYPDLPGPWCEHAAELAQAAGLRERAARFLVDSARRALKAGALATAESTLRRARTFARGDLTLGADIDEVLLEALTLAGRAGEAIALGSALLETLAALGQPLERVREIHLRLAHAAVAANAWVEAKVHLEASRIGESETLSDVASRVRILAAQVAMGEGRSGDGMQLAHLALASAEQCGRTEVACEALEVLGRACRLDSLEEAREYFSRAASLAERDGLAVWRLRALHELGTIDALGHFGVRRLEEARALAEEIGALATVAVVDVQLAGTYALRFEPEPCLAAAGRCVAAARRLHLGLLAPVALAHAAVAHAAAGRRADMERALTEAFALAGDDPDVAVTAWGHGRAVLSLLEENRARALEELDQAIEVCRAASSSTAPVSWGPWALLRTLEELDGDQARAEARRSQGMNLPFNRSLLHYADAVALGRNGSGRDAAALVEAANESLSRFEQSDGYRLLCLRLVAEAAIDDGWGSPTAWLLDSLLFFEARGHPRIATACRSLLARAGAPVPRKGRGQSQVSLALRRRGVTSREADVLALVARGMANREIAESLYLSVRTVEKHVERLMDKTGAESRSALAGVFREQTTNEPPVITR